MENNKSILPKVLTWIAVIAGSLGLIIAILAFIRSGKTPPATPQNPNPQPLGYGDAIKDILNEAISGGWFGLGDKKCDPNNVGFQKDGTYNPDKCGVRSGGQCDPDNYGYTLDGFPDPNCGFGRVAQ